MPDVVVPAVRRPFTARITPPGSKSLTNRALVLGALAGGSCEIENVLFADDTDVMLDGLGRLGFAPTIERSAGRVRVDGRGGALPRDSAHLFCGNSGTTIRFLTALCALGHGRFTLDGVARMRQRPIGALTALLDTLGVRVRSLEADGFPPVEVEAAGLAGGTIRYGSEASSQYLSAILMVAPYARDGVRVELTGAQTSWPYVAMTLQLMERFGIAPRLEREAGSGRPTAIVVPRGTYAPTSYVVEPDASNASYFLATAAVNPGTTVTVERLDRSSLQGDVGIADVLGRMGAEVRFGDGAITVTGPATLTGLDVDLADMPDMAQTVAVVAVFARGPSRLRGLHTLRVKETDRIAALAHELKKLGADVAANSDALSITPPACARVAPAPINTYDDHRMAMSFAVAGTRVAGLTIRDAECVGKTYPRFFDDLRAVLATAGGEQDHGHR